LITTKKKLSSIDCRHFDFGKGTCPFGTSCFYKHAYKDGRREEVKLRHLGAADGSTVIAKDVRLSDFLGRLGL
jgi:E3 ubiquitin-protein ligase makorin